MPKTRQAPQARPASKAGKVGKRLAPNPDLRRRSQIPAPPVEEIERRLRQVLTPAVFAPGRRQEEASQRRDRILTLPVMTAIVVSLVWRGMPSLAEALRVLAREGLLWVEARAVSRQALSQRMAVLPAGLFGQVFAEVVARIRQQREAEGRGRWAGPPEWEGVVARFPAVWVADGSTLEALRKRLKELAQAGCVLGGKMMVVVEAFSQVPMAAWYTKESGANDKTFGEWLLAALPVGGLLIFDLGFFSFPFFDQFTAAGKYFVTRLREKTAYRVIEGLGGGSRFQDRIVEMGMYRSNPCVHRVRLVSVLWGTTWYHYLTNVLDPQRLSAQQVCDLYRRRWRIEDAFLLTKRLLGLAYLWVAGANGIAIQVYATWIFYAVLMEVCQHVAEALQQPLERISVEMVFRGFYHFSRALDRGERDTVVGFLAAHAKLLGIVKAQRRRHRHAQQQQEALWDAAAP